MKVVNIKTSIGGVVNAIAAIAAIAGVVIAPEQKEALIGGAVALAAIGNTIIGLFAKDNNVTGGSKINKNAVLLVLVMLLSLASTSFAANVNPTYTRQYLTRLATWQLSNAQAVTGNSDIAVKTGFCIAPKTIEFVVTDSGGVNIVADIYEGANNFKAVTYTFIAAGTYRYAFDHTVSQLYIDFSTLTNGTVTTNLECTTK